VTSLVWGAAGAALVAILALGVLVGSRTPSNDRDWAADHAVPARVDLDGNRVFIGSLRDFRHHAPDSYTEGYRDEVYDLADVRRVWFVLAPFARRWRGLAHTLLSFELTDDRFVSVSVEARREAHEAYSLVKGLLRGFEVTYVIGTESDVIGLRAVRGDTLFLYPSRATPEQSRALFVEILQQAEAVRTTPTFYNTFTHNCTTTLREAVNRVASDPLPWGWGILLPGYSDRLALEHGLLDTDLDIEAARERFRVDERALQALQGDPATFGAAIRAGL
jgi:hypothetical protein